jgi:aspartate ammonia-lyase
MKYRFEKDYLGGMEIPENVLWGIHTARAIDNFRISGEPVNPRLIKAMILVKKACALSNSELGYLPEDIGHFIVSACDKLIESDFREHFTIDALQGGAGTSTNMNLNEVIANLALEEAGYEKGRYQIIDPILHVNLHQSTNDVYPTALKTSIIMGLRELSQEIAYLQGALQAKEKEFSEILTIGRTELQDAVPMTLGAQFASFAEAISRDRWRVFKSEERLRTVNLGGTAIGTGLTAARDYIFLVIEKLRQITGLGLTRAEQPIEQTANADVYVETSGMLNAHAINLIKIAGDLRLLHYLGEISLPPVQAGSSIMPGKVNPVIIESVIQTGMKVRSACALIAECCSAGTLQINEFLPLIAHEYLRSIDILININKIFTRHVMSITANPEACREYFEKNETIITAFLPLIGYKKAEEILSEYRKSGRKNLKIYLAEVLGEETVNKVLAPAKLMSLGYRND